MKVEIKNLLEGFQDIEDFINKVQERRNNKILLPVIVFFVLLFFVTDVAYGHEFEYWLVLVVFICAASYNNIFACDKSKNLEYAKRILASELAKSKKRSQELQIKKHNILEKINKQTKQQNERRRN